MRYFLECAYRGDRYFGWQRQPHASSVQQTIETALSTLLGMPTLITGAGRTDTGVHARQMFAHFDLPESVDAGELQRRLNRFLPAVISINDIRPVQDDAHARFDALTRRYEYWVVTRKDVFLEDRAHFVYGSPEFTQMNRAATRLLGHRDFACFSKSNTDVRTYLCTLYQAEWQPITESHWVFVIEADRFLRNMVRAVVGTLLEIGQGRRPVEWIDEVLTSGSRSEAGVSVPAKGLYLTEIKYPNHIWQ